MKRFLLVMALLSLFGMVCGKTDSNQPDAQAQAGNIETSISPASRDFTEVPGNVVEIRVYYQVYPIMHWRDATGIDEGYPTVLPGFEDSGWGFNPSESFNMDENWSPPVDCNLHPWTFIRVVESGTLALERHRQFIGACEGPMNMPMGYTADNRFYFDKIEVAQMFGDTACGAIVYFGNNQVFGSICAEGG
jgi:hypothetical protein